MNSFMTSTYGETQSPGLMAARLYLHPEGQFPPDIDECLVARPHKNMKFRSGNYTNHPMCVTSYVEATGLFFVDLFRMMSRLESQVHD